MNKAMAATENVVHQKKTRKRLLLFRLTTDLHERLDLQCELEA